MSPDDHRHGPDGWSDYCCGWGWTAHGVGPVSFVETPLALLLASFLRPSAGKVGERIWESEAGGRVSGQWREARA